MTTPFRNEIVGGTTLKRRAIKSPNYTAGVTGWTINKDGSAEFNNGVFRGTVTAGEFDGTDFIIESDGAFFYSSTPSPPNFLTGNTATFDSGLGTWGSANSNSATVQVSTPVRSGTGAMRLRSLASGTMQAGQCATANILTQGLACAPGDQIFCSAWLIAATVARSCAAGCNFYTNAGVFISTIYGTSVADNTSSYTRVTSTITAPATAAFAKLQIEVLSTGAANEDHFADDPFIANATATAGNLIASIAPASGTDPFGNAFKAGLTSYQAGTGIFANLLTGLLSFGLTGSGFASDPDIGTDSGGQQLIANSASNGTNNGTGLVLGLTNVLVQKQAGGPGQVPLLTVNGSTSFVTLNALTTGSVANSTAETDIGHFTIPANDSQAGSGYRFRIAGSISTAAATTPTLQIRVRLNGVAGTLLCDFGTITCSGGLSGNLMTWDGWLYVTNSGASGHITIEADWNHAGNAPGTGKLTGPVPAGRKGIAVDTTAAVTLTVTAQWGTANSGDIASTDVGSLERIVT